MSVNANFFTIQVKWKIYYSRYLLLSGTCNRKFARGKQVIMVKCEMSFQFRSKGTISKFGSGNQIHEFTTPRIC